MKMRLMQMTALLALGTWAADETNATSADADAAAAAGCFTIYSAKPCKPGKVVYAVCPRHGCFGTGHGNAQYISTNLKGTPHINLWFGEVDACTSLAENTVGAHVTCQGIGGAFGSHDLTQFQL
jgi:hypothetical protein